MAIDIPVEIPLVPPEGIVLGVQDDHVTVQPYYGAATLRTQLKWKSGPDVPWAIGFLDGRTPFTDGTRVLQGFGSEMYNSPGGSLRSGHYRYRVAILGTLRGRPAIFLDAACPEIIVP